MNFEEKVLKAIFAYFRYLAEQENTRPLTEWLNENGTTGPGTPYPSRTFTSGSDQASNSRPNDDRSGSGKAPGGGIPKAPDREPSKKSGVFKRDTGRSNPKADKRIRTSSK